MKQVNPQLISLSKILIAKKEYVLIFTSSFNIETIEKQKDRANPSYEMTHESVD